MNMFDLKPYDTFVIVDNKNGYRPYISPLLYFDGNGEISIKSKEVLRLLCRVICGFADVEKTTIRRYSQSEIDLAKAITQMMGETAKARKIKEDTVLITGDSSSHILTGEYFPSINVGDCVYLRTIGG